MSHVSNVIGNNSICIRMKQKNQEYADKFNVSKDLIEWNDDALSLNIRNSFDEILDIIKTYDESIDKVETLAVAEAKKKDEMEKNNSFDNQFNSSAEDK